MKTKIMPLSNRGFTLIEVMIVMAIFTALMAGVFFTLLTGQNTWFTANTQIELQENLRLTLEKVSRELRQSGSNSLGVMQLAINNNTGLNATDTIVFSVPVVCEAGAAYLDINGDVTYWGAPLTWGCDDSTCMDADDDCSTVEYQSVEYLINASNQLVRRVINNGGAVVGGTSVVFAQNITDFQADLSADQNMVTLTITASKESETNRQVTLTSSLNVFLRNRG